MLRQGQRPGLSSFIQSVVVHDCSVIYRLYPILYCIGGNMQQYTSHLSVLYTSPLRHTTIETVFFHNATQLIHTANIKPRIIARTCHKIFHGVSDLVRPGGHGRTRRLPLLRTHSVQASAGRLTVYLAPYTGADSCPNS